MPFFVPVVVDSWFSRLIRHSFTHPCVEQIAEQNGGSGGINWADYAKDMGIGGDDRLWEVQLLREARPGPDAGVA